MKAPNPRLSAPLGYSVAYGITMLLMAGLVTFLDDAFYRFAFFFMALAFSFQYWTLTTARGERAAVAEDAPC